MRGRACFLLAAAAAVVVVALVSAAAAQPSPIAIQFLVNAYTVGNQVQPSVCTAANGDFVVAFLDHYPSVPGQPGQDGSGTTPCLRRFHASGNGGFEVLANTYVAGDQVDIRAACAPGGDFIVSWTDTPNADGGRTAFVGRAFNETSLPKANPFVIRGDELIGGPPKQTALCRASPSDFVAVWVDGDGSLDGRRYDANGAVVGADLEISLDAAASPAEPACCGGDSGFVVAWADEVSSDVLARRFSSLAEPLGTEFVVNAYATGNQLSPSVACNDEGRFAVTWDSNAQTGTDAQDGDGSGVFGRAFDSDGSAVGTELRANTYTTADQRDSAVVMDATGRFVVVWESAQLVAGLHGVFGRAFAAGGAPIGTEFRADASGQHTQSSNSDNPALAMQSDTLFVVAWENDEDEISARGVFARLYDFPQGATTTTVTTSTTIPSAGVCGDPVDAGSLRSAASERMAARLRETPRASVVTTSDALFILRAAVGAQTCEPCVCDVDASASVSAADALIVLKAAVGQSVTLNCPAC